MNLVEWYSEERTATALGVSTRTVRRMAQDGTLRRAWRPVKGRKPEAAYHPEDVEKAAQTMRRPTPVEDTQPPRPEPTQAIATRPGIPEVLERFGEIMQRGKQTPPLWLTIEAASEYSGLSQALIHRLVISGQLAAIGDAAIKVRRTDLDQLDLAILAAAAPLDRLRGRSAGLAPAQKNLLLEPSKKKKSM
jgi:hypothetical protein